jgi:hypothetical protein
VNEHSPTQSAGRQRRILAYENALGRRRESRLDFLWALLLALPGVYGFALLIAALGFNSRLAWEIGPRVGLVLWAVAFASATYSFCYFRGRPKSVWTKCCLAMTWLGVIFTVTPPGWIILLLAFAGIR